ncbi:hypothetical protein K439DRAFT_836783 [Ramaria rubella]|nr:hypothetical protein K439DRAFT_836783 [Ramaria rubella]
MGRKQPSLHFDPPLEHAIVLKTPLAPTLGSRLRWHAVLPREDYSSLCIDGIKVQLWSDASKVGEWSETMFEERVQLDLFDQAVQHVDISLVESTDKPEPSSDLVSLEATVLLSPLIGRTVQYTYRLVDASGEVRWLGTEDTNGTIVLSAAEDANTLRIKDWTRDEHGVFSWTSTDAREAMIVTKVSGDAHWKCWACTSEG